MSPGRVVYSIFAVLVVGISSLALVNRNQEQAFQVANAFDEQQDSTQKTSPSDKNPSNANAFKPIRVLPKLQAITEIPIVAAADAEKLVDDDELVLGVEINGKARAYPLNMLNGPFREIFNDELGGTAIAATW